LICFLRLCKTAKEIREYFLPDRDLYFKGKFLLEILNNLKTPSYPSLRAKTMGSGLLPCHRM